MFVWGKIVSEGVTGRGLGIGGRLGSRFVSVMGSVPIGVEVVDDVSGRPNRWEKVGCFCIIDIFCCLLSGSSLMSATYSSSS